ncbi:deoxyribose-phosphate aldolase OS=Streptomyces rutgersensis OX=53451 GN=deoC PE=4 SV=1 [Streptomyces diastaticus subsp. diastaticus]
MVPASWLPEVVTELSGTGIEVASALDFPTVGVMTSAGKAAEAAEIARLGATQLDIGVQIGWLKSGRYDDFREDIAGVVRASGLPVKVMLELPAPSPRPNAKQPSNSPSKQAPPSSRTPAADRSRPHTPQAFATFVDRARNGVQVKASGSIKTYRQALQLLRAGASLLGTSAGLSIITDTGDETTASY